MRPDLITLTEELTRRGELEAVGGQPYLASLFDYAATSANVDQHLDAGEGEGPAAPADPGRAGDRRRRLRRRATRPRTILDRAEARIFEIGEERTTQGFVADARI